jgi:hypothetical protein
LLVTRSTLYSGRILDRIALQADIFLEATRTAFINTSNN